MTTTNTLFIDGGILTELVGRVGGSSEEIGAEVKYLAIEGISPYTIGAVVRGIFADKYRRERFLAHEDFEFTQNELGVVGPEIILVNRSAERVHIEVAPSDSDQLPTLCEATCEEVRFFYRPCR